MRQVDKQKKKKNKDTEEDEMIGMEAVSEETGDGPSKKNYYNKV